VIKVRRSRFLTAKQPNNSTTQQNNKTKNPTRLQQKKALGTMFVGVKIAILQFIKKSDE